MSWARPARVRETREFSDPAQPGQVLELTLQEPDAMDRIRAT